MKYDDLEKTHDLFDIDEVPSPILDIEMEGVSKDNVTDEFTLGLSEEETKEVNEKKEEQPKEKKKKEKKKFNFHNLSKKQKILFIGGIVLVIILIVVLVLFLVLKKDKKEENKEEPDTPSVIVEKENYIYQDGVLTFLDINENELGTYECINKKENLCYVGYYSDEDSFDNEKNVYEDTSLVERRSKIYKDRFVFIYDNETETEGTLALYDIVNQEVMANYQLVKGFNDSDYVILKDLNNKYGALTFTEEEVESKIEFSLDYLGMLDKDSKVVEKNNNNYYIANQNGKVESKGLTFEIKKYNDKYIVVDDNGYFVYDYKGNLVFNDAYDYVDLLDNYAVLIKNQKLYIRDFEGNKYNENGISLKNKYYNPENVYDKNKVFIEKKYAYDLSIDGDNIVIKYIVKNSEESQMINILEGKLSSKLNYVNYFDGTLYFYEDEEKDELLGKYTCSNKNIIDKKTTTLNNCMIATESFYSKNEVETDNSANLGIIPIYNKRYAFILDSIDSKNPTIMLYDLKTSKTISKYASIDAGNYAKEDNITFMDASEIYVMAQNKNNKYGIIRLSNEVTSIASFNYTKVEKLRNYYLVVGSTNNYMLIDKTGEAVTEKLGNKIVDYKGDYLKLIDSSGKYIVSDSSGDKADNTGYLDVTLYNDFYAVIDSNKKLNIGTYNDFTLVLSEGIDIGDNYKNNYEVTKTSTGYSVKIKSTGEVKEINLAENQE